MLTDVRELDVDVPPERVFTVLEAIGGESGWYSWPLAWRVRGLADRLIGGPGLRRGRRSPTALALDDVVDVWRVEDVTPGTMLRLRSEMRLPGSAWLEFRLNPRGNGEGPAGTHIVQRALFEPRGLAGQLYWAALLPFHPLIFSQMIAGIAEAAALIPTQGKGPHNDERPASAPL